MTDEERVNPDARVVELGYKLPEPIKLPPGVEAPLAMVVVTGKRCVVSGHGPQLPDGSISPRLGQLGGELTVEDGEEAARLTALSILGTLQRELGSLDKIRQWIKVFGMVNSAPGFNDQTRVINAFSQVVIDVFGRPRGVATRSAVGMASLPFSIPVEVECEVELY